MQTGRVANLQSGLFLSRLSHPVTRGNGMVRTS